jgi:hypothetical protein
VVAHAVTLGLLVCGVDGANSDDERNQVGHGDAVLF